MNSAAIAMFFIAFHMIGDYVTQTNWMAANKFVKPASDGRASVLYPCLSSTTWFWIERALHAAHARTVHVTLYSMPFLVLAIVTGSSGWLFWAVFIPHWIIDCRRWASPVPWPPKPILVDQSLHALHLAIVFAWFYGKASV